jgi:integrase
VDEEAALFTALRPDYHPIVRFALLTGCRLAECVGLTWTDVHWGERLIWVNGKGGKRASIPMPPAVRDLLWPLQGQHPTAVFTYAADRGARAVRKGSRQPVTYEGLKTHWRRAKAASGVPDYRFHDNRHTAATRVLRASGNLHIVKRMLRHEDIATTVKYAHSQHDDVMAAMEAAAQPVPTKVPTGATVDKLKAEG